MCLGGEIWLNDVLYSPDLTCSLMSVAKLLKTTKGSMNFTEDVCVLQDRTSKMMIGGEECDGVYKFRGTFGGQANKVTSRSELNNLWHRRLGHPSSQVLSYLSSIFDIENQLKQTEDVKFVIEPNKLGILFLKVIIKRMVFLI